MQSMGWWTSCLLDRQKATKLRANGVEYCQKQLLVEPAGAAIANDQAAKDSDGSNIVDHAP